MPYKNITMKIKEKDDKRIKLSSMDRIEIFDLYASDLFSQRELARTYNVSRRLIQFIIDPTKLEESLKRKAERGGSKQYYDKDKNNVYMKSHRDHKQKLYIEGELDD